MEKPTIDKNILYMMQYGNVVHTSVIRKDELSSDLNRPMRFTLPYDITNPLLKDIHLVEQYMSDLLVNINSIRADIMESILKNKIPEGYSVIGFRKYGVDGETYVICRLKEWFDNFARNLAAEYYRRMYIVKWYPVSKSNNENFKQMYNPNDIIIELIDASNCIPYNDQNE